MNSFTYNYPVHQYFGAGTLISALNSELPMVGKNILLAFGCGSIKRSGLYEKIKFLLQEAGKNVVELGGIKPNPTYNKVQEGAHLVLEHKVDFILAVGGGSVLDCCKIISAQALLDEDIWDMQYLRHKYTKNFIPMGAVVTAFGTGAEQNNCAVITHEEKRLKQPLFGAYYNFVVLDSDLTKTMSMMQMISGAFDTLSHCMETYMGQPSNSNLSDEINEAVMRNIIQNIITLIKEPDNEFVRGELMWAAAIAENGILKLGKITDFQCHMLEHAVAAYTDCNHGQGLAIIHPVLYRSLIREGELKLSRMAQQVWGVTGENQSQTAMLGIEALAAFIKKIGLPSTWSEIGITDENILRKAADSCILTKGCSKHFTRDDLFTILKECM